MRLVRRHQVDGIGETRCAPSVTREDTARMNCVVWMVLITRCFFGLRRRRPLLPLRRVDVSLDYMKLYVML